MLKSKNKKKNIAFLMLDVADLKGGGGAERFFSDFFTIYNEQLTQEFNLFFLTDSLQKFKDIGKFKANFIQKKLIELHFLHKWFNSGHKTNNQFIRKPLRGAIFFLGLVELWFILFKYKINLVHVALFTKFHYPFLRAIDIIPKNFRPKIVINIVDHLVPYYYFSETPEHIATSAHRFHYEKIFSNIKIDGVYSWYKKFKEFAETYKLIKSNPEITVIKSRFVINHAPNNSKEIQKNNTIIFAARLVPSKQPLFFVEGINCLYLRSPEKIANIWKFEIYGKGKEEENIKAYITKNKLQNIVSLNFNANMAEIFSKSKCFVSTQDFENFPSMSMAEAMINKNAIIARDVGQTDYFVKDEINGYLLKTDTPEGLADCLEMYIDNENQHSTFGLESYKLMTTVHTPENFIIQTNEFWWSILNRKD